MVCVSLSGDLEGSQLKLMSRKADVAFTLQSYSSSLEQG